MSSDSFRIVSLKFLPCFFRYFANKRIDAIENIISFAFSAIMNIYSLNYSSEAFRRTLHDVFLESGGFL